MGENHEKQFVAWIKSRAESSKVRNIYESKSWLLTGSSIYPNNLSLKMMCYRAAKSEKSVPIAANHLAKMLETSGSDSNTELFIEMKTMLKCVQSDSALPEERLNKEIFKFLPNELQCKVLQKLAAETQDVISKCSILLQLVETNPFHAREYGMSLIETLFEAEIKESPQNIRNVYRRYFVSDVLPMMLEANPSGADKKMLLSWLDKAFQYYVVTAFQSHKEGLMSPTASTMVAPLKASRPWDGLAELLILTAQKVKIWSINSEHFKSEESLMQYLTALKTRLAKEYSKTLKREFIYIGTYLLLKQIYVYNGLTRNQDSTCIVQKSFPNKLTTPRRHKKNPPITLTAAGNVLNGDELISAFKSACTVWTMLHNDTCSKGYAEFLDRLDYPLWRSSLANFTKDRIVYQQEYKDYPVASGNKSTEHGCYRLQRASCQFALGLHKNACEEIVDVVTDQLVSSDRVCHCQDPHKDGPTAVEFMFISHPKDVFNCGITILISALRGCLLKDPENNDIIGNLCVLSQLHWPKYKMLFSQLVAQIKEMGSFTYQCFFDYVINIEILEEFAYLKTEQGGSVDLELQTSNFTKIRTVTRGVTRDAREDFKTAFEKQITRSSECMEKLIVKFLVERKHEILSKDENFFSPSSHDISSTSKS